MVFIHQSKAIIQKKVFNYLKKHKSNIVLFAAGVVGGIHANNVKKANFIYENIPPIEPNNH